MNTGPADHDHTPVRNVALQMERRITPQHESIYESQMEVHARYQTALDGFLSRALEGYGERIEHIILFGTVARGEAKAGSDIDFLLHIIWKKRALLSI
jgi:hypothetical protein